MSKQFEQILDLMFSKTEVSVLDGDSPRLKKMIIDAHEAELTRFAEEVEREVIGEDLPSGTMLTDMFNDRNKNQRQKLATLLTQWKGEDAN